MELSLLLVTFGALLLASLAVDAVGRLTRLPRITLLVLLGLAVGPAGADLLPIDTTQWQEVTANLALTMIAFLLGGELSRGALAAHGRAILAVSLTVTVISLMVIGLGLWALGAAPALALLLAGVGLATDPAATRDTIDEARADGPMTRTVLGVVAIDDAWGVIVFSLLLGLVSAGGAGAGLMAGLGEVALALALGAGIGLPAAYATGRVRKGQPTLAEALGLVLLIAGLCLWLEVSFLLAGMAAGAVIVNLARHHDRPFHEIERVSWPFLVLFFVLAGAALDPTALALAGPLGAAYVLLRIAGRGLGGWIGARLGGLGPRPARLIGLTLTPQAGVALGMALVAAEALPEHAGTILPVTVATTILFELIGPLMTARALHVAGEASQAKGSDG